MVPLAHVVPAEQNVVNAVAILEQTVPPGAVAEAAVQSDAGAVAEAAVQSDAGAVAEVDLVLAAGE